MGKRLNRTKSVLEKFKNISKKLKSKFVYDYNVSNHTWFRAGGHADYYCIVVNENELEIILSEFQSKIPIFVIGVGSNVLVRDGGFKGLIIKLGNSFNKLNVENLNIKLIR